MRRAVVLGIAMSVLGAACALVEPAAPATSPVQISVSNNTGAPVDSRVTMLTGDLVGSAVPAAVPNGALRTPVTIHVPVSREWILQLGGREIPGADLDDYSAQGCMVGIDLHDDGGYSFGCADAL